MEKLGKSKLPSGHSTTDFKCFGPVATKDGEFDGKKIVDLGCFTQDGKDSNKFYHGAVVQSTIDDSWYTYFEWGRVLSNPDFQFYKCDSETEAQQVFEKQIHSKNDKRGEWFQHPALGNILRAKAGKDCYLVRPQAVRTTGLPDAKNITTKVVAKAASSSTNSSNFDKETSSLLKDLQAGTISYTKGNFSGNFIPTIEAIEEARLILGEAAKSKGTELVELTKMLYSKIPKRTGRNETVTLSSDNIQIWSDDLDVFEDAYNALNGVTAEVSLKYFLSYIDKNSQLWYNIDRLVEQSTKNVHSYLKGKMKIRNIWEVKNIPESFTKKQEQIAKEYTGTKAPLIFQPERTDLEKRSNTAILFHGTRSCNTGGIITTGFRLPKHLKGVAINGAALGAGCYHASDWKKSAGYCSIENGYWSRGDGQISNRKSFMFLNDVILGNPKIVRNTGNYFDLPKPYHSIVASGGSFANEEYVVYSENMFYPRYLLEFDV